MSRPFDAHEAEALLRELERRLGSVDARLLASEPAGLEQACVDVRDSSLAVADLLAMLSSGTSSRAADKAMLRNRIDSAAQRLLDQRRCLARRSAVVERTLDSIMRPQKEVTYRIPGERCAFSKS